LNQQLAEQDIVMESQLPPGMSVESLRDLDVPTVHRQVDESVTPKAPQFVSQIKSFPNLKEGDNIHFECRLEPTNDPYMTVEWYHNGEPLRSGYRHKTVHDFGFVSLDIISIYPEVFSNIDYMSILRKFMDNYSLDIYIYICLFAYFILFRYNNSKLHDILFNCNYN
jgi:hypothetical protein